MMHFVCGVRWQFHSVFCAAAVPHNTLSAETESGSSRKNVGIQFLHGRGRMMEPYTTVCRYRLPGDTVP